MHGRISVKRAREAVRLVCEVREIGVGTERAREHLLAGLASTVGAAVGAAVLDHAYDLGMKGGVKATTLFGFDDALMPVFAAHHSHGSEINPVHRAMMLRRRQVPWESFSVTERHVVTAREWDWSPWVAESVRPKGLAHYLGATRSLGGVRSAGVGFMRVAGDRPFTREDCDVLELVVDACGRLFPAEPGLVDGPNLTPCERETLERRVVRFERYELDLDRYELRRDGVVVPLTPRGFDLLAFLIRHRHRVVSKEELLAELWPNTVVTKDSLPHAVMALRRALGDGAEASDLVGTVRGRGYRFVCEVDS